MAHAIHSKGTALSFPARLGEIFSVLTMTDRRCQEIRQRPVVAAHEFRKRIRIACRLAEAGQLVVA